jgi:hypothetical protein
MARTARNQDDHDLLTAEPVTETITYVPGPLDPVTIKWAGHTFAANVPKEITGHATGSEREKANLNLIESARTNKHFTVGNAKPKRDAASLPTTADGYKAYMVGWLKDDPAIETTDQLIGRFAKESPLREACEVGHDDYQYLSTLFMPKLYELAKADELSKEQLAALWINHGINQLPWAA